MHAADLVLPDVEAIAVSWATVNTALAARVAGRVSTQLGPTYPQITVTSSGVQYPMPWYGLADVVWSSWADSKAVASAVDRDLLAQLPTIIGDYVTLTGRVVSADVLLHHLWSPDPDNNRPRYITTAVLGITNTGG